MAVALPAAIALAAAIPNLAQLQKMTARFAPTEIRVDISALSANDREALVKLIQAAHLIDDIYLTQVWSGNQALYQRLQKDKTPLGKARLHYFWLNKGPWSELDDNAAFIPGVPARKPPGANSYPEDVTKAELETWSKTLPPAERKQAEGFFTVIRRGPSGQLVSLGYEQEYASPLAKAASLLREAAELTANGSLKKFLRLRAEAFSSNDYYASDVAWMDLDSPLDVTIGPYETYDDELFGYKAAFEAYINLRDEKETERLRFLADHLQEVEDHLPIDPQYRNKKLGGLAPIRVVNEILAAGDGAHGVQTAAYNLPNDERIVREKGSKRVMLKNVQDAKFQGILIPISKRVLPVAAQPEVNFDSFFIHIVAHELSHGLGPQQIEVQGRTTSPRQELKELYSAIEEAKADVTGLFLLQYLSDQGTLPGGAGHPLYTTYLASAFRTLRFGLKDAHARSMAMQFNYLADAGAIVAGPDGTFRIEPARIRDAVRDLDHDLLTIEATGDYAGAKKMLDTLGRVRPEVQQAIARLAAIPTDIEPIFVTARNVAGR